MNSLEVNECDLALLNAVQSSVVSQRRHGAHVSHNPGNTFYHNLVIYVKVYLNFMKT